MGINERAQTALGNDHFLHPPTGQALGGKFRVVVTGKDFHFVLVYLQYVHIAQCLQFFRPVHRINILSTHLAQIALRINGQHSLARQIFNDVKRKVICQQTAQVINVGLHIAQTIYRKGVGLGQHTLCAVVLVLAINIFKIDRELAGKHFYGYSLLADFLHS